MSHPLRDHARHVEGALGDDESLEDLVLAIVRRHPATLLTLPDLASRLFGVAVPLDVHLRDARVALQALVLERLALGDRRGAMEGSR
jgi:hypothetical protein